MIFPGEDVAISRWLFELPAPGLHHESLVYIVSVKTIHILGELRAQYKSFTSSPLLSLYSTFHQQDLRFDQPKEVKRFSFTDELELLKHVEITL